MGVRENLSEYITKIGINQRHLSRVTGIAPNKICKILKGTRGLSADEFELICKAIDKDPSYFMNSKGDKDEEEST